jgi:phosphatidylserine decarboxylase
LNSDVNVLTTNARSVVCIDSPYFGKVLFVAIGAFEVGSVKLTDQVKGCEELQKGEEIGWFEFGGSSIIVAFEEGRIHFDEDLREVSKRKIEMDVLVGQSLGKALKRQTKSSD